MTTALEIDYEWLIGRINDDLSLGKYELSNILSEKYTIPTDPLERALFLDRVDHFVRIIDLTTRNRIRDYYKDMVKVRDTQFDLDTSSTHLQHIFNILGYNMAKTPTFCCSRMMWCLTQKCKKHNKWACPDILLTRNKDGTIGLIIHDGGTSSIKINYCPWCGAELKEKWSLKRASEILAEQLKQRKTIREKYI